MALQYRKLVRDAVLAALKASFNTTLNGLASAYGITPQTLDFSTASKNFAISYIDPTNIENCQIEFGDDTQVGGCLYTCDVVTSGEMLQGYGFAGKVAVHLDLYVRDRTGVEGFNSEDYFDAYEDAAVTVLQNDTIPWPSGVLYSRQAQMAREYLVPLGDGFATRIPIKAIFEVYIP